ncbi:hypothetical protein NP493_351g04014 [Ridgeia piscesae]|uniref:Sulfhydryl oxidase n=1 Tax=Ridgeia piscesae TaxID=27915 RepID=A0AAD9L369_RIDPI|nr:hypothetical protein NP493_351g04014 [Ridgeia piscesae]
MIVHAELTKWDDKTYNPKEVPLLMNDYIQQFFGCRECAENFGIFARRIINEVVGPTDAIFQGLFDPQPGWDEAKVLQYLMMFYAKKNVKQDGVTSSKATVS